jgi:sodium transport system ATP-binding protein
MIEAHDLTKTFCNGRRGEIRAVDRISFSCRAGEIYGLLGANGAGKTTTLRMLATLLRPTSGTASLAGFDITSQPERVRAQIGFMTTSTALYDRLTARETLAYFGRLNGLDNARLAARTQLLADALDMHAFLDMRVGKFSTGMKQKTSMARTLIHDPAVIILDEPTLGLDVMAARAILEFVRDCRARGKTVIYSTHVMSEVEKICDVIGIIHNGKLVAEGTLGHLREQFDQNDMEEIFVRAIGVGKAA